MAARRSAAGGGPHRSPASAAGQYGRAAPECAAAAARRTPADVPTPHPAGSRSHSDWNFRAARSRLRRWVAVRVAQRHGARERLIVALGIDDAELVALLG